MTEEDEDDKDDIRIATLESQFENKETVCNWSTINLSYTFCDKLCDLLLISN